MTKTQISVRVSPDTMVAIDAAAQQQGVSRGHIIDRWLAAQAAATSSATPIEQQAWYRARELAADAQRYIENAGRQSDSTFDGFIVNALRRLAGAIELLAGTAPE